MISNINIMAFKKSNAIRRDTLTHLPSFMKFLVIPFMGGNRDPKWIITGYINGKRNYNVNVMKQLYYIMKNVRISYNTGYWSQYSNKYGFITIQYPTEIDPLKKYNEKDRWVIVDNEDLEFFNKYQNNKNWRLRFNEIRTDPYYYDENFQGNIIRYKHLRLFLENKNDAYVPKYIWYDIASINKLRGRSKMKRKDLIKAVLKM